jgi:hypothetical protein
VAIVPGLVVRRMQRADRTGRASLGGVNLLRTGVEVFRLMIGFGFHFEIKNCRDIPYRCLNTGHLNRPSLGRGVRLGGLGHEDCPGQDREQAQLPPRAVLEMAAVDVRGQELGRFAPTRARRFGCREIGPCVTTGSFRPGAARAQGPDEPLLKRVAAHRRISGEKRSRPMRGLQRQDASRAGGEPTRSPQPRATLLPRRARP